MEVDAALKTDFFLMLLMRNRKLFLPDTLCFISRFVMFRGIAGIGEKWEK